MVLIGITGPTGAGKTTLLREVEALGGAVIDCDAVYQELLEHDPFLQRELERRFGPLRGENGAIDRKRLGTIVFGDPEKLALLNMGLEDRMKQPVGLLSGGQRQALTLLMATLVTPKLLLLDEHTAALDPKTAAKVLALSEKIVQENHLTTLMITHNMRDAIRYGNRLIMMNEGHVIYDVRGEEKTKLEVSDLLQRFEQAGGEANDRMILS